MFLRVFRHDPRHSMVEPDTLNIDACSDARSER